MYGDEQLGGLERRSMQSIWSQMGECSWKKKHAKYFLKCQQYMMLTNVKTSFHKQLYKEPYSFLVMKRP